MSGRFTQDDPYWHAFVRLGEAPIQGKSTALYLRLHTSRERYTETQELVPLSQARGERLYVHARPFILLPDIQLQVRLEPHAAVRTPGAIGTVESAEIAGERQQEIGNAQAWLYPADQLLVLWECYLHDRYRQPEPQADPALLTVWTGFERVLGERLPAATRIVTPAWEDIYPRPTWQAFLTERGYRLIDDHAMLKEV